MPPFQPANALPFFLFTAFAVRSAHLFKATHHKIRTIAMRTKLERTNEVQCIHLGINHGQSKFL